MQEFESGCADSRHSLRHWLTGSHPARGPAGSRPCERRVQVRVCVDSDLHSGAGLLRVGAADGARPVRSSAVALTRQISDPGQGRRAGATGQRRAAGVAGAGSQLRVGWLAGVGRGPHGSRLGGKVSGSDQLAFELTRSRPAGQLSHFTLQLHNTNDPKGQGMAMDNRTDGYLADRAYRLSRYVGVWTKEGLSAQLWG